MKNNVRSLSFCLLVFFGLNYSKQLIANDSASYLEPNITTVTNVIPTNPELSLANQIALLSFEYKWQLITLLACSIAYFFYRKENKKSKKIKDLNRNHTQAIEQIETEKNEAIEKFENNIEILQIGAIKFFNLPEDTILSVILHKMQYELDKILDINETMEEKIPELHEIINKLTHTIENLENIVKNVCEKDKLIEIMTSNDEIKMKLLAEGPKKIIAELCSYFNSFYDDFDTDKNKKQLLVTSKNLSEENNTFFNNHHIEKRENYLLLENQD